MKHCSGCDRELPEAEFYRRSRAPDGLQNQCKTCQLSRNADWATTPSGKASRKRTNASSGSKASRKEWARGRGRAKAKDIQRKHAAAIRGKIQALVSKAKDVPCADCGQRFHPVAMDFDHVRGEKRDNVARLATKTYSLETIQAEIDKCEVVCSNCHRVRSFVEDRREISNAG